MTVMHHESQELRAKLITPAEEVVRIHARKASKYSLWVRPFSGGDFPPGEEFTKLIIQMDKDTVTLGPCRLLASPAMDGYQGRVVFTSEFYDLEKLLGRNKLIKLQSEFLNLPLILAHKDNISKAFKDYASDLNYDLSIYKNLFDKLDEEYREEPEDVKAIVRDAIAAAEGRPFHHFLDESLADLERLVRHYSKEEHERHGFYLRKQLWNFIMCSPLMARTNLKPRGYSGDSVMMRMIYTNGYEGDSIFSQLINKHPLEHPGAQAVRNRREIVAKAIRGIRERAACGAQGRLNILSVASGPAWELQDIMAAPDDCAAFHFTLLDQDAYALTEAAQLVREIEAARQRTVEVSYLNESVRTMLSARELERKWGRFDLIYSMGLFDYLTPPVATAVLRKLYDLLVPGGEMVIGNFHVDNPSRCYMEYWLDWVLYYRNEDEFAALLGDLAPARLDIFFDDSKVQMFLHVTKRG
jgi:extracellular factor (EF) 3-hydroxypalmitic acid methyl ester biosynthesis protein